MPIQVARYSLTTPMVEEEIEHETIDTSIVTFIHYLSSLV